MNAVDTNILIYTHDPRDPVKQSKAVALIASLTDGVLLWQVACEYVSASRKLTAYCFSQQQAYADLRRLRTAWKTSLPSWPVMDKAEALMATGNLSFWDAMIIAACVESGVKTLYSEDFDSSTSAITGVRIVNPLV
ncbi:MAG: PIN domain-containing protein [Blastocatellales bacterium]